MDYPFFIAKISSIPNNLIEELSKHVICLEFDKFGYLTTLEHTEKIILPNIVNDIVYKIADHINLPKSNISTFNFSKVASNTNVIEHTDLVSAKGTIMNTVVLHHKIHIPIITDNLTWSSHRKSKKDNPTDYILSRGYAYAYNDYCWHSIQNNSNNARYHLIIRYRDDRLTLKYKILTDLGINPKEFYECEPYLDFEKGLIDV